MGRRESSQLESKTQVDTDAQETSRASKYRKWDVIVNVFLTSTTVVLNISLKEAKSRPTILLGSRTKIFAVSQLTRFVLLH